MTLGGTTESARVVLSNESGLPSSGERRVQLLGRHFRSRTFDRIAGRHRLPATESELQRRSRRRGHSDRHSSKRSRASPDARLDLQHLPSPPGVRSGDAVAVETLLARSSGHSRIGIPRGASGGSRGRGGNAFCDRLGMDGRGAVRSAHCRDRSRCRDLDVQGNRRRPAAERDGGVGKSPQ